LVDLGDAQPEPGPGEDAGLNKTASLPSYGAAAKPPSIHSVH
jgi:hypothetical protein